MKQRVIVGLILTAFAIPFLILSDYVCYPIALSAFALVANYEALKVTGFHKYYAVSVPVYLISGALPILTFYLFEDNIQIFSIAIAMALFIFMLYLFGYSVFHKGRLKTVDIALEYVLFLYITGAFTSLAIIRYRPMGEYFFVLVYLIGWMSDIFAYFVGRAIGKHKLIPEVSPKKTVEGSIAGLFFSTVISLVYGIVISYIPGAPTPNYFFLGLTGFVLALFSQIGDLFASLVKREKGIKDFGGIFPGHGGVLDRFDSIIAVAPVFLALFIIAPPFV